MRELLRDLDVLEWIGDPDVEVTTLTHDSRRVSPGACFACLPGATTDGHDHAPEAVASGAVALLVERALPVGVTQARVADTRRSVGPAAARAAGDPSRGLRVVGITGTNGKTTTVALLEAIGRVAGRRVGVVGTLGTRVGASARPASHTTPEAPDLQAALAEMRAEGVDLVAMEVSSHALARHRVDGTHFAVACFTNLSHDHLDEHHSMEGYFAAKRELFAPGRAELAVVNVGDPFGARLHDELAARGARMLTYARSDDVARLSARDVRTGAEGTTFELVDTEAAISVRVHSPLAGLHNVDNQLAAAACAVALGIPHHVVAEGLALAPVLPGRLEQVDAGQPFTVVVDYAHAPGALAALLDVARSFGERVVMVFGCGGDRDPSKRPAMGAVAEQGATRVFLTSDNPRSEDPAAIAAAVLEGMARPDDVVVELDRRRAIGRALDEARPGDVVVIAGKGHETGQTRCGVTAPFDDRVVARELLEAR